jgi:hypothetical protein
MVWCRGLSREPDILLSRCEHLPPPRKTPINWEVEDMAKLVWEMIEADPSYRKIERAKVPGGWLIRMEVGDSGGGITFVPDPNHEWE